MENNFKHTPGPWFEESGYIAHKDTDGDYAICEMHTAWNKSESRANAKLIAAAPDLLEALQNLENDDNAIPAHAWDMVQKAIQKATE